MIEKIMNQNKTQTKTNLRNGGQNKQRNYEMGNYARQHEISKMLFRGYKTLTEKDKHCYVTKYYIQVKQYIKGESHLIIFKKCRF